MFFILALLAGAQAADGSRGTDYKLETIAPLIDLQTCITRKFSKWSEVSPIPLADGVALDVLNRGLFGNSALMLTVELHDLGSSRLITFRYRHPMSEKAIPRVFKDAQKACVPEPLVYRSASD
jgi:hypothetical protein